MTNLKNLTRRGFALLVVLAMCLSLMNVTAFAEETAEADPSGDSSYTEGVSGSDTISDATDTSEDSSDPSDDSQTPSGDEGSVSEPDEGEGDVTTPDEGEGDVTTPDEGEGDVTTPDEGEGDVTNPDEGEGDVTTPDEGEGDVTNPDEGEGDVTTPDEGEGDVINPDEGEEVVPPAEEAVPPAEEAVPPVEEEIKLPLPDELIPRPEESQTVKAFLAAAGRLPEAITAENAEEAEAMLQDVLALFMELNDDEQELTAVSDAYALALTLWEQLEGVKAETPDENGVASWEELNEAIGKAETGTQTTIIAAESFEIGGQIGIPAGKDIILVGANPDMVISRADGFAKYFFTVKGSLTLKDIVLDGRKAESNNSIVYVYNMENTPASFTMEDGAVLRNNTTKSAGGAVNVAGGTFTMNGGEISNNTTTAKSGGGVYVGVPASFNMNGGSITGNSSKGNGGGICTWGYSSFSGDAVVTGNTKSDGTSNNLYIASRMITVSDLGADAQIGVSLNSNEPFAVLNTAADAGKFLIDGDTVGEYSVVCNSNGQLRRIRNTDIHASCGNAKGTFADMMALANQTGGTVTLLQDVTYAPDGENANIITVANSFTLDLGRHTLSGYGIQVSSGTLTVEDIRQDVDSAERGVITGCKDGYAVTIRSGAELAMKGGSVSANASGVYNAGTLSLSGKINISGNKENNVFLAEGGKIQVGGSMDAQTKIGMSVDAETAQEGTVLVSGVGSVTQANLFRLNTAGYTMAYDAEAKALKLAKAPEAKDGNASYTSADGAVTEGPFSEMWKLANQEGGTVTLLEDVNMLDNQNSLDASGTFTLNLNGHTLDRGYAFTNNTRNGYVILVTGNLTLEDTAGTGRITGGSYSHGGGVYVAPKGIFTMTGGTITRNTASECGGGVYVLDGTFTMTGGTITENSAKFGGGVNVCGKNSTFTMGKGAVISKNSADSGAGVYVYAGGTAEMKDGEISCNTADNCGGGVAVFADSKFVMHNGSVSYNVAGECGGGIHINNSISGGAGGLAEIFAGVIEGNAANIHQFYGGGGIYVSGTKDKNNVNGTLKLHNAAIYGNKAVNGDLYSGGIAGCPTSNVKIYLTEGGVIYGNEGKEVYVEPAYSGVDQHEIILSPYMLGGGAYNWTDKNGNPFDYAVLEKCGTIQADNTLQDKDNPILIAMSLAQVFIRNNTTNAAGAGIGTNGDVIIGTESSGLRIEKQVVGTARDTEFTFTVTLTTKDGIPYTTDAGLKLMYNGDITTVSPNEKGELTLTLKAGEYAYYDGIPDGVEYTVTENANHADSTSILVNGKEATEASGTISEGIMDGVVFVNTYNDPTVGILTIEKKLAGSASGQGEGKEFVFAVTGPDGYKETVRITGSGKAVLTNLKPGDYTVTEEDASVPGFIWSVDHKDVTVKVEAGKTAETVFTNTYEPQRQTETGSLTITKVVSGGGSAAAEKVYTFIVTGPNGYRAEVTVTGSGSYTLSGLALGSYTVTEQDASIAGYTWSVSGNNVTVEVTANQTAQVTVTNTYTTPDNPGGPGRTPPPTPPRTPETPEPEVPDPEVPRAEPPEETEVEEPNVPLSNVPEEEVEIPEPEVPLDDAPQTGDTSRMGLWLLTAAMSCAGFLWLSLTGKKRDDETI